MQYLAGGVRASYTYDKANQLTKLWNLKSDGTIVGAGRFDYDYDAAGNRTGVTQTLPGNPSDTTSWTYDAANQLRSERRNSGSYEYLTTHTYDGVGNRLYEDDLLDGRTTYTYDPANQLTTMQNSSGITTFTFDAAGNQQVSQNPAGQLTTNVWNDDGRRSRALLPTGIRNTFVYDGDLRRVQKQDSTGTSKFIYDGQAYLLETDGANASQVVYTHGIGPYGNLASQYRKNGGGIWVPHYYSYDALGSAERLTDADQVEETGYAYYAFGKILDEFGSAVTNPFRFIGQLGYYFDKDLDEMHVRARDYHPSIIRWLSPDPVDLQQVTDMLFTTMHLHYYAAIAFPAHQAFDLEPV